MLVCRALWIVFLVLFFAGCGRQDSESLPDSHISQKIEKQSDITLKDAGGRWLVVNIWADWCAPCLEEIPELNALSRAGDIRVVGIDYDGSQGQELSDKVHDLGIDFPVVSEDFLAVFNQDMPSVLPTTYIVSPLGQWVDTRIGSQTREELEDFVSSLKRQEQENE